MFLLDIFMSEDKKVERHIRRLTDRDSQPEDRDASARFLAERGSRTAIIGLLQRFDLNLEHQMKDSAEKDVLYGRLLALGPKVSEPLRAWVRQCKQFAMPIKLLAELESMQAAIDVTYELLQLEIDRDDFKPEKKKALLVWLAEVKNNPSAVEHAAPFLVDFDEGVRYAACEVCITAGTELAGEKLQVVFTNPREESGRLRTRVAEVYVQRGWQANENVSEGLPGGFRWKDGRIVAG